MSLCVRLRTGAGWTAVTEGARTRTPANNTVTPSSSTHPNKPSSPLALTPLGADIKTIQLDSVPCRVATHNSYTEREVHNMVHTHTHTPPRRRHYDDVVLNSPLMGICAMGARCWARCCCCCWWRRRKRRRRSRTWRRRRLSGNTHTHSSTRSLNARQTSLCTHTSSACGRKTHNDSAHK